MALAGPYEIMLNFCVVVTTVSGQLSRSVATLGFHNPSLAGFGMGNQNTVTFNPLANSMGRFPSLSGLGGTTMGNTYGRYQQQYPDIYTAIGKDEFDDDSQVRLTITERTSSYSSAGYGAFDSPTDWYVQGTFLNSQLKNKAGTYYVVLTSGGRTADGCDGTTLGRIIGRVINPQNPFLQSGAVQSGVLPNQLLMGAAGPTVYASTLQGISRRQLVGGAIAACQSIQGGYCSGYIPFCATISKDIFPAMEIPDKLEQFQSFSSPNVVPFGVAGINTALNSAGGLNPTNNIGNLGLAFSTDSNSVNAVGSSLPQDNTLSSTLGLFA